MLSHADLLDEIRRLRDDGVTSNAELARLLNLPTSRIADIFATDRKPRKISLDEAKLLVERFGLETRSRAVAPNGAVLTATFVVMLGALGIDPYEDGRAHKLAERFPRTLQQIEALHAVSVNHDEPIPGEAVLDHAEGQPAS